MKPILVDKANLIEIMEENRGKHRKVFNDALAGYARAAEQVLREHMETLRQGKYPEIRILLERPEDHTRDYDRVIGMLKMHTGDTFELDEQSYRQFVDDDWTWKRQWLDTNITYAAGSVAANYEVG
jgi:hypothetical protein